MIRVKEQDLPEGLKYEEEATAGFSVLVDESQEQGKPPIPVLVCRYSDHPSKQRWAMISRIDSNDPAGTFEGMTASDHWLPWDSVHPGTLRFGNQVAWSAVDFVVWVVSHGLDDEELRTFVAAISIGD